MSLFDMTKTRSAKMIKLYGFGPNFGLVDPSPFVVKVDCFMRMAKIDFEYFGKVDNMRIAPKKKLPYIEDDGKKIADSHFIIKYLTEKYNVQLDETLSAEQKGSAYLLCKSLDEHLYWIALYSRWIREDTWPIVKKAFFSELPFPLKFIIPCVAYKTVAKNLFAQGTGRHSDAELQVQMEQSMQALSIVLGDKNYFFAEKPVSFDATVYAFVSAFIEANLDNPFNKIARKYENLKAYCEIMTSLYYS